MKKKSSAIWKNVEVEDPELKHLGLVAFEECTDYSLLTTSPARKRKSELTDKRPKKKAKLQKSDVQENCILTPSKTGSSHEIETHDEEYLAWTAFGVPDPIIKALKDQNFTEPTQIQSLTLPPAILGKRDIIGAAETGSGKTLAFGLPILAAILNEKSKKLEDDTPLYALILTPTRELAVQVKNHLVAAAKYTDIKVAVLVGGMAPQKQERMLSKNPEIVVATPGRLWELFQQGNSHLSKIDDIKFLVIDETDRMLERGHFEELHDLLERLNMDETKKKRRQNFVFSATLTMVHELPKYLTNKMRRFKLKKMTPEQKLQKIVAILGITNPKIVDVTKGGGISGTLTECRITCRIEEKDYYVYYFLEKHPGRTLIFCNSIGCVRRLSNLLGMLGCRPLPLHASMAQRQRLKNLERFRDDERGILVATDVAARGLDIPKVEHVLHYQTPRTSESYVHRSGRTARASNEGITVLLIEPSELPNYIKMCKTLEKSEDLPTFPVQEGYLNAVKDRVNLARQLDKLELQVRKSSSEAGWIQKAAEDLDIIVDDFVAKYDTSENSSLKKLAEVRRKQLNALLGKPVFPRGFSGKYLSEEVTSTFILNSDKAVDVMKGAMKNTKNKNSIPLYKPKKKK